MIRIITGLTKEGRPRKGFDGDILESRPTTFIGITNFTANYPPKGHTYTSTLHKGKNPKNAIARKEVTNEEPQ